MFSSHSAVAMTSPQGETTVLCPHAVYEASEILAGLAVATYTFIPIKLIQYCIQSEGALILNKTWLSTALPLCSSSQ